MSEVDAPGSLIVEAAPPTAAVPTPPSRWAALLQRLSRLKGPIAAIAGVGAIISGLLGYYTAYKTVTGGSVAPVATAVAPAPGAKPLPTIEADPSIAVLPLSNPGGEKEGEILADGIAEDVLNLLAKVPKLRVIARTSSFSFKGKDATVTDIARQLNVAAVLEGSVRKAGNQVRLAVRLVRASDGSQLWSETFDRSFDDIFKTQDEIVATVVRQLNLELMGRAPKTQHIDTKAYSLILQAHALRYQATPEARVKAMALYQQALAIEPDSLAAWVGVAVVAVGQADFGERPQVEAYAQARKALGEVLAVDPENSRAHSMLGVLALNEGDGFRDAAAHMERALASGSPNDSDLTVAAFLLEHQDRLEEAIALLRAAFALSPTKPSSFVNLSMAYSLARRWDEAVATGRAALAQAPGLPVVHCIVGQGLLFRGDAAGALAELEAEPNEAYRLSALPMALHALGRQAEADAALKTLIAKYDQTFASQIAAVFAYRGQADRAFEWMNKAAEDRAGLAQVLKQPQFDKLQKDPRWTPFLQRIGRTPEQLAAVRFTIPPGLLGPAP